MSDTFSSPYVSIRGICDQSKIWQKSSAALAWLNLCAVRIEKIRKDCAEHAASEWLKVGSCDWFADGGMAVARSREYHRLLIDWLKVRNFTEADGT